MNEKRKFSVRLDNVGAKHQTVYVYGLTSYEDKSVLYDLIDGFMSTNRKVGEKLEAWKLCDTPYSFKFAKQINNNVLQFDVA